MESIIENLLIVQNATGGDLQAWLAVEGRPKVETIHYTSDGWDIEAILDDGPLGWWDHHLKGTPLPATFEHKQLVMD